MRRLVYISAHWTSSTGIGYRWSYCGRFGYQGITTYHTCPTT